MSEPQSDLTTISESDGVHRRSAAKRSSSSSAVQRSVLRPANGRRGPETREHSREWSRRTR
jgi:hypothetical protein